MDDGPMPADTIAPSIRPAPPTLADVLMRPDVWRGATFARVVAEPSGHPTLDAHLPGGGWPVGALTELLLETEGIGELGLVMPWLGRLTRAGGRVALIDPPHLPFAPALAEAGLVLPRTLVVRPQSAEGGLWALEQTLRNGSCGAVIGWHGFAGEGRAIEARGTVLSRSDLGIAELKRLQLAAESGRTTALLFRPATVATQPSTAALRMKLSAGRNGQLQIDLMKARGGRPAVLQLAA
jgi:hypothetical protein